MKYILTVLILIVSVVSGKAQSIHEINLDLYDRILLKPECVGIDIKYKNDDQTNRTIRSQAIQQKVRYKEWVYNSFGEELPLWRHGTQGPANDLRLGVLRSRETYRTALITLKAQKAACMVAATTTFSTNSAFCTADLLLGEGAAEECVNQHAEAYVLELRRCSLDAEKKFAKAVTQYNDNLDAFRAAYENIGCDGLEDHIENWEAYWDGLIRKDDEG